jgi:uncharacterized membrane protein (UPF0127 family)
MKKWYLIVALIIGTILISTGFIFSQKSSLFGRFEAKTGLSQAKKVSVEFDTLELADENAEQANGLMYRRELCANCGMLFVFENNKVRSFWMKNTFISLDIIFITENGLVDIVHENTEPESKSPTYDSLNPVTYVLEIPSGRAKELHIEKGVVLNIQEMKDKTVPYFQQDN